VLAPPSALEDLLAFSHSPLRKPNDQAGGGLPNDTRRQCQNPSARGTKLSSDVPQPQAPPPPPPPVGPTSRRPLPKVDKGTASPSAPPLDPASVLKAYLGIGGHDHGTAGAPDKRFANALPPQVLHPGHPIAADFPNFYDFQGPVDEQAKFKDGTAPKAGQAQYAQVPTTLNEHDCQDSEGSRLAVGDAVAIVGCSNHPKPAGMSLLRRLYPEGTTFLHGLEGTFQGSKRHGWLEIQSRAEQSTFSVPAFMVMVRTESERRYEICVMIIMPTL
jgi:hypothetical protein